MKRHIILGTVVALFLITCTKDVLPEYTDTDRNLELALRKASPTGDIDHFILPASDDYENIPQYEGNPLSNVKVTLGGLLFHETGLALSPVEDVGEHSWSCASCHLGTAGFMPGAPQGIADGGMDYGVNGEERTMRPGYEETEIDAQGIRAISLLNAAYVTNGFWNGQFGAGGVNEGTEYAWDDDIVEFAEFNHLGLPGLETQAFAGLELHRMVINKDVLDKYGYTPLFDAAFNEVDKSERYTDRYAGFAIAAYLRCLMTNDAPFQRWLKGEKQAMTASEKRGAELFFGKARCFTCHKSPSLNSMEFYALGTRDLYEMGAFNTDESDKKNLGRGGFTGKAEDMYKFKVPQLYNMGDSPFYFHGSSKRSLREVVEFFNEGKPENPNVPESQIAPNFIPLHLTNEEVDDLTQFLETGLRDPNVDRFMPKEVLSGYCFPNNDPHSQEDLGCN